MRETPMSIGNPFYENYVFTEWDLFRVQIKWWQYPWLIFKRTFIQVNDGYAFHYKLGGDGMIYLMKTERVRGD